MTVFQLFSSRQAVWRWAACACWMLVVLLASTAKAQSATAPDRVALVIGNAAYTSSPLLNPGNDARAMSQLLRDAGFTVDAQFDTSQQELSAAVARFGAAIRDPKIKFGLFYYAGHGVQLDWRNYLVPVSAKIRSRDDVLAQAVDVSELLKYMEEAKGRSFLVILDACRDDPFAGTYRPPAKGLSQFDAPVGSMLAYATAPGSVALDGIGENGLYTSNLLREFAVRGARVEDVFKRVRLNVRLASKGQQIPWESTSLEEDLYLFPTNRKKLSEAEQDQLLEQEIKSWLRVKSSNDALALANFVREYPSGSASELAQSRLNRLLAQQAEQENRRMGQARDQLREQLAQAESARLAAERTEAERQQAAQRAAEALAQARAEAERAEAARLAAAQQAQQAAAREAARLAQQRERDAQRLAQERAREAAAREAELAAARREAEESARLAEAARVAEREKAQAVSQVVAVAPAAGLPPTPYSKGYAEHRRDYRVGDELRFRVIDRFSQASKPLDLKVTAVSLDDDRVEYNGGAYVSDTMGNIVSNTRGVFSTPRQFYPAELFVGKRWKTRFKQARPNGITYTYAYDVKVVGRESVTVPAGTFDAFRIEAQGFNVDLGATLTRTIWVAPGVPGDIAHEITVRLRNGKFEQFDRQELVAVSAPR